MDINERVEHYLPERPTGGRAAAAVLFMLFLAAVLLVPAGRTAAQSVTPEIVSGGNSHTCGLKPDGSVACWGYNDENGQAASQTGPFTQVSVGYFHTCGLKPDGSVQCWGYNQFGQSAGMFGPFTQISAGGFHTCGLKPDGSVQCWGEDGYGQAIISQTGPFTQVSAGGAHTCGLKPDGSVQCWGRDDYGQSASQAGPFTQVSAGGVHTCGLKPDGSIQCWGWDESGQSASQTGPFTQVGTGEAHTCGHKPDGRVQCWGENGFGQSESQTSPFTQVSVGGYHNCGLKPDGSVECWGWNGYGQAASQTGPFGPYVPPTTITIVKQVVPRDIAWWSFDFTGDLGAFSLSNEDEESYVQTFADLDAGTYTITETAETGYSTEVSCDSGESGTNSVDVDLAAGEDVFCTFTNTVLSGITVVKQVVGGDTPWSFAFTGDLGAFSLSDTADSYTANDLDADTYTISETAAPGYSTSVSCDNGESGTSSVDVVFSEGEHVTCTFTNTALGGITIVKQVVGGDTPWSFDFTGDLGAFSLSDTADSHVADDLDPDTYTITESEAVGYSTVVSCDNGASGTSNVDVDLAAGENVICTFTNTAEEAQVIFATAAGGTANNDIEPDVAYLKGDILKWDGALWTKWFSGVARGLKPKADLTAFDVDEVVEGAVWLSWLNKLSNIPGVGIAAPQDIVYFNGVAFQPFFDGSDVGMTTKGEGIDGVEVLPGGVAQGFPVACAHYLLITTQAGGTVRNGSEPVIKFTGEDVLGFCMISVGNTTVGLWQLAVDLGSEGLNRNNSVGLSVTADANTLYFLPKKTFTLDGVTVKPSEVAAFDRTAGTFHGPIWKAKDHGLMQLVDGIDRVLVP